MDKRVQTVIIFIEENMSRQLTLNDLARSVNLSASRLRHLFKSQTGQTPTQYLKSRRMLEAKKLIENTCLTEKQIMVKIGVNDLSHFVRDFKITFGLTPTQYRFNHFGGSLSNKDSHFR